MQTKIVRLHDSRRNRRYESLANAEIRELRRQLDAQNRVIADLIMDMRAMNARIAPPTWGFDPRDTPAN